MELVARFEAWKEEIMTTTIFEQALRFLLMDKQWTIRIICIVNQRRGKKFPKSYVNKLCFEVKNVQNDFMSSNVEVTWRILGSTNLDRMCLTVDIVEN